MSSTCHSMTGYGRAVVESEGLRVTIELRSVNHRFLDTSFKLPRAWMALEQELAGLIRGRLGRGRIEVFARRQLLGDESGVEVHIDSTLARSICEAAGELAEELRVDGSLGVRELLGMSGVLTSRERPIDASTEAPQVVAAMEQALDALLNMRRAEGQRLAEDLLERIGKVADTTESIAEEAAAIPDQIFARVQRRVTELLDQLDVDPHRLAQEAALLADKAGVDEEIIRLRAHVAAVREQLGQEGPIGRRLEFLVQEMGRETNTIGSKSASSSISGRVVDLKSELEKIREQVANLE